jgi:molybdopterin synthase catalytic subunit
MDAGFVLRVVVEAGPFDEAAEVAAIRAARRDIGAVVSFLGLCRDEGGALRTLEIEAYPAMAEAEIRRIAAEAARRWPLAALTVLHRFGTVVPGDAIVLVAAAAPHRGEAFAAVEFVMDFLKTDAPFWKKEHLVEGSAPRWLSARDSDQQRKARWERGT